MEERMKDAPWMMDGLVGLDGPSLKEGNFPLH